MPSTLLLQPVKACHGAGSPNPVTLANHWYDASPPSTWCGNILSVLAAFVLLLGSQNREWPRYCRKVYWTKMVQNGPNDHFGRNALIPNWNLAFARPKWTKMVHFGPFWPKEVHFGPFRSANRTLATPDRNSCIALATMGRWEAMRTSIQSSVLECVATCTLAVAIGWVMSPFLGHPKCGLVAA